MTSLFIVCLVVGLLVAVFLAVAGDVHIPAGHHAFTHPGAAAHQAVSGHGAASAHHAPSAHGIRTTAPLSALTFALSWLSPVTVAGAGILFGGVGLLLGGGRSSLPFAVAAAVAGAVLFRLLMRAFVRSSSPPLYLSGDGAIATVNSTIRPNSPGEVSYTLEGLHRNAIARSEAGIEIPRGTQVVITRRDRGVAWVEPLDPIDELPRPN